MFNVGIFSMMGGGVVCDNNPTTCRPTPVGLQIFMELPWNSLYTIPCPYHACSRQFHVIDCDAPEDRIIIPII